MSFAFVYPMVGVLARSVFDPGFTVEHYRTMIEVDAYARILANTFRISITVTLICLLLGYPVAYVMAQAKGIPAKLLTVGVVLPLWTTELVRIYAWTTILSRTGPLNWLLQTAGLIDEPASFIFNATGLYIGAVHVMLPFMILPLFSVMRGIDQRLLHAAQTLGATPLRAFVHVYLPLSMPGVIAGLMLVFIITTGLFVAPSVLGGEGEQMIAMVIETQARKALNWGFAAALSAALVVATVLILWLYNRLFGLTELELGGSL
jgi:ABC-type spermidine/putrescine transport system permease subunit I